MSTAVVSPDNLLPRWHALCKRLCPTADTDALFNALMRAYGEPHRYYHTAAHIADCLHFFDSARALFHRPDEAEWALWFHDIVYDTHAHDNEERSAEASAAILRQCGSPRDMIDRITTLILATRHTGTEHGHDAELVVDIDLAILGSAPQQFDAYNRAIRSEYAWVPEELYSARRREILSAFLHRTHLYHTPFFRSRYEQLARLNLQQAILGLANGT